MASDTPTMALSIRVAKIEELRELDRLKKDNDVLKLHIEKLNLEKEKLDFALSKSKSS